VDAGVVLAAFPFGDTREQALDSAAAHALTHGTATPTRNRHALTRARTNTESLTTGQAAVVLEPF
jgi:hypothetical protein